MTARHLSANHVHPGLPLAVDATSQSLRPELIVVDNSGRKIFGMLPKQLNVFTDRAVILLRDELFVGGDAGCIDHGKTIANTAISIKINRGPYGKTTRSTITGRGVVPGISLTAAF